MACSAAAALRRKHEKPAKWSTLSNELLCSIFSHCADFWYDGLHDNRAPLVDDLRLCIEAGLRPDVRLYALAQASFDQYMSARSCASFLQQLVRLDGARRLGSLRKLRLLPVIGREKATDEEVGHVVSRALFRLEALAKTDHFRHLTTVCIRFGGYQPQQESARPFLEGLAMLPSLRELDLANVQEFQSLPALDNIVDIFSQGCCAARMQRLCISMRHPLPALVASPIHGMLALRRLRTLKYRACPTWGQVMLDGARLDGFPMLEEISVYGLDRGLSELSRGFVAALAGQLTKLTLTAHEDPYLQADPVQLTALLSRCSRLEALCTDDIAWSAGTIEAIQSSLKELVVWRPGGGFPLMALMESLHRWPALQSLRLYHVPGIGTHRCFIEDTCRDRSIGLDIMVCFEERARVVQPEELSDYSDSESDSP